jgi:sulfate transport system permease protein
MREPRWLRLTLLTIAIVFLVLFIALPLIAVFVEALRRGAAAYFASFENSDAWAAVKLTLLIAAIVVPINTLFGIAAGWCIARFNFRGKNLLTSLIDLPFAVSPVISGLIFVLIFGRQGWFGPYFMQSHWYPMVEWHGFDNSWWPFGYHWFRFKPQIIFAVPGMVIATLFITFPFVARELIPLMQEQGSDEEQAALLLGASGWTTFRRITLPKIRWALLYGIILCNARAMGEFGAVSVVSGHIRGRTNTIPLHVEILYNEYNFVAAFAVASLLALLGIVTLIVKSLIEWKTDR